MTNAIAIDFGTSRTKLAYWNPILMKPQLMRFYKNNLFIPSLFYLPRDSNQVLLGHNADEMWLEDHAGIVDSIKNRMRESVVRVNRRKISPGELLSFLFRHLRERAESEVPFFYNDPPHRVFLTIPALHGPSEEQIMRDAAIQAGFEKDKIEIVVEPIAAARAWLTENRDECSDIIILDCGGGNIDLSYLRCNLRELQIVLECPPRSYLYAGKYDIEQELLKILIQKDISNEIKNRIEQNRLRYLYFMNVLKERHCRGLSVPPLKIGNQYIELTEHEIQSTLNSRFIQPICDNMKVYLEKVKTSQPGASPKVLIVGGDSMTKGLKEAIEAQCECTCAVWKHSEYATVLGAIPPIASPPMPVLQYYGAVKTAWMDKKLDETKAKLLNTLISKFNVNNDQSIQIETEIMGYRKEAILEKNVLPQKINYTLSGHTDKVWSVAFSPDSKLLASASYDSTVRIWSVINGKELKILTGHTGTVLTVAYSPDGKFLASGGIDKAIKIWDAINGRELKTFTGHEEHIYSLVFSPNGRFLASGSADTTKLWDVTGSKELFKLNIRTYAWVSSIAFSPNGKLLVLCTDENTIKLYNTATGKEVQTLVGHTDKVRSVAFSPDAKLLASGSNDCIIKLWDIVNFKELCTIKGSENCVNSVVFSLHGQILASCADKTVRLWNVENGQGLRRLIGHKNVINCVRFSPDGQWLASCDDDCIIRLWQ